MQHYTIHLPVKSYIKKYLTLNYGHPIYLNSTHVFSDVLLAMLLVPTHAHRGRTELDQQLNRLSARLEIKVPIANFYRLPKEASEHSIVRINRYFENMFKEDLAAIVQRASWFAIPRQTAIECFAANHGIELEYDISFEALKKMEWRHRTELETNRKKFLPDLSRTKTAQLF